MEETGHLLWDREYHLFAEDLDQLLFRVLIAYPYFWVTHPGEYESRAIAGNFVGISGACRSIAEEGSKRIREGRDDHDDFSYLSDEDGMERQNRTRLANAAIVETYPRSLLSEKDPSVAVRSSQKHVKDPTRQADTRRPM